MKNELRKLRGLSPFACVPEFGLTPTPRCHSASEQTPGRKCGEPATRRRPGNHLFGDSFHCDQHALETDVLLNGEFVLRRVRLSCDILLAGVDGGAPVAEAEALERIEQLVQRAGGMLEVVKITSTVGRYPAHAGRSEAAARARARG